MWAQAWAGRLPHPLAGGLSRDLSAPLTHTPVTLIFQPKDKDEKSRNKASEIPLKKKKSEILHTSIYTWFLNFLSIRSRTNLATGKQTFPH